MSQRALAGLIGFNQSYLSSVQQGRRAPSRRLLEGVSQHLDLPVDYFREYREAVVHDSVKTDLDLLDRVYRMVIRAGRD
jgi:transcriptional regulator with XRE-family HTH domain